MTVPSVSCTNCGKNFTTDDLRGTSCRFCGTLLAHHARAAQQVAVVNQMLADRNGNGIPDAYEGLMANAQANALNQAFGMSPPSPYGPPAGGFGAPMNPYNAQAQMHVVNVGQQVNQAMSKVTLIVVISIIFFVVLMFAGAMTAFFFAR